MPGRTACRGKAGPTVRREDACMPRTTGASLQPEACGEGKRRSPGHVAWLVLTLDRPANPGGATQPVVLPV